MAEGTTGNDVFNGTSADELYDGLEGSDSLSGAGGNDTLLGGAGQDTLIGGAGNDSLDGGTVTDRVNYTDLNWVRFDGATTAVNVNLSLGTAQDGQGGTDTLANIDFVTATEFNDVITGSSTNQLFEQLDGGLGNDTIDGGFINSANAFASNRVIYNWATAAVVVNLGAGTATGGGGNDTLININYARGSDLADVLTGSNATAYSETFEGRGGNDTIDGLGGTDQYRLDGSTTATVVNLATGTASDGQGGTDTLYNIENVRGADQNDHVTGNSSNNSLEGRNGNDSLYGGDGQDTVNGGAGDDYLDGGNNNASIGTDWVIFNTTTTALNVNLAAGTATGEGTDTLVDIESVAAGPGNDSIVGNDQANFLQGGLGNDTLDGGAGIDWADYQNTTDGVTVSLVTNTSSGAMAGVDTLLNFEQIRGGTGNDSLEGNSGNNWLRGLAGNDTLNGGDGFDTADYLQATSSVTVNLQTGASTGPEGADTFFSIEAVRGSNSSDTLTGDSANNVLYGGAGNDVLIGGAGDDTLLGQDGQDTLQGGAGNDSIDGGTIFDTFNYTDLNVVSYSTSTGGIVLNLATGTASDGMGGTDTLVNMNFAVGSPNNDSITGGTTWFEQFEGGLGDDTIDGGALINLAGNRATYRNATGAVTVDLALNKATGADGTDTLVNINLVRGSLNHNDTLLGSDRTDVAETFDGLGGSDSIDGRGGVDWLRFDSATGSVTANLQSGSVSDGLGGTDTVSHIENIRGSGQGDNLTGDAGSNELDGRVGNDTINGGEGNDNLFGAEDHDSIDGGAGDDNLYGGSGNDTLLGGNGFDYIRAGGNSETGSDSIDGGADHDVASYDYGGSNSPVTFVSSGFGPGTRTQFDPADGSTDTLTGIEEIHIFGSNMGDSLTGDSGRNYFGGNGGNDTLTGNGGGDTYAFNLNVDNGVDRIVGLQSGDEFSFNSYPNPNLILNGPVQSGDNPAGLTAGQVMVGSTIGGITKIYVGTDGLAGSDLTIELQGSYAAADFSVHNYDWGPSLRYEPGMNVVGTSGDDNLNGGNGSDTIDGLGGRDSIFASDGNDSIQGGEGDDYIQGQNGNDTIDGGAGYDTAAYGFGGNTPVSFTAVGNGSQPDGNGGTDTLSNIEEIHIYGGNAGDTLTGNAARNYIAGNGGNDTLTGNGGNDSFAYNVSNNEGVDLIVDFLAGNSLDFSRNFGDPTFALTGAVLSGDDPSGLTQGQVMVGSTIGGVTTVYIGTNGAPGGDLTIQLQGSFAAADFHFNNHDWGASLRYVPGTSIVGTAGNDNLNGDSGNDTIQGLEGNDGINGNDGNDSISAGDGDDNMQGGPGNDTIDGGAGYDVVGYGFGGDTPVVFTAVGNGSQPDGLGGTDTLSNIEEIDIHGGNGGDTLTGNAGRNYIAGNGGNDTLAGNGGNDSFAYNVSYNQGVDLIVDLQAGNALDFYRNFGDPAFVLTGSVVSGDDPSALTQGQVMIGSPVEGVTTVYVGTDGAAGGDITIQLQGSFAASDFQANSYGWGSSLRYVPGQYIGGTAGDDNLNGDVGNDTIEAGSGNDTLRGNAGDDFLSGGSGDDRLSGDQGDDEMVGGAGDDIVEYSFWGFTSPVYFTSTLEIDEEVNYQADGMGGIDELIGVEQFHIFGGSGNDSFTGNGERDFLEGRGGDDTLMGGAGYDTFAWEPGSGNLGHDLVKDLSVGENLHFRWMPITEVTSGDGTGLGQGEVAFARYNPFLDTTTMTVGVDTVPGADLTIELVGSYESGDFNVYNDSHGNLNYDPANKAPAFTPDDAPGSTTTSLHVSTIGTKIFLMPNGTYVVAASVNSAAPSPSSSMSDVALARFDSTGHLDYSFANGGRSIVAVGPLQDSISSALIQPDGKVLVAGSSNSGTVNSAGSPTNNDFYIARFNADGSLDTSFDADGKVVTALSGGNDSLRDMQLQADGKIVVAGSARVSGNSDFVVVRYNADGSLDTGFGTGGSVTTAVGSGADTIRGINIQGDGKILAVGGASDSNFMQQVAVARYNANGTLDTGFGTGGKLIPATGLFGQIYGVRFLADGKFLVTGTSDNTATSSVALARYNADGTSDNSFGTNGMVTTAVVPQGSGALGGVRVQPDGKIVVAGYTVAADDPTGGEWDLALVRYNTDGSLDTSFGVGGKVVTDIGHEPLYSGSDDAVYDFVIEPDGKITVVGQAFDGPAHGYDLVLARYNADGTLDTNFGGNVPTFYAVGDQPVVLDHTIALGDVQLDRAGYDGSSLTLARQGGANAQDVFSASEGGSLSALTQGADLVVNGVTIGMVTANGGGQLVLNFNGDVNHGLVNAVLHQIAFSTSAASGNIQLDWAFNDGNNGAQGYGGSLTGHHITTVNVFGVPEGTSGDDNLTGGSGDDLIDGKAGNDNINGGAGNDTLLGDTGNDYFHGDGGNDSIDGGPGEDWIFHDGITGGITVDLAANSVTGAAGNDTVTGVESVGGTNSDDSITGDGSNNTLQGRGGNDTMDGAGGFDTADYYHATGPVTVSLATNTAIGADGNDLLSNFESVTGSFYNDSLTGNGSNNNFTGLGGNDTIDGGGGFDSVQYWDASAAVTVNLSAGTATGASGNDVLVSIENVGGSSSGDAITGDANNNNLRGEGGNDTLLGGAGSDSFNGGAGNDSIDGGTITDRVNYVDLNSIEYTNATIGISINLQAGTAQDGLGGTDTLANINFVTGSFHNDSIVGSTEAIFEQFEGRTGNDTIDGGAINAANLFNANRVSYVNSSSAVTVNLASGTAIGGDGNDTLLNINYVRGSNHADSLIGSDVTAYSETFEGRGGNDTIDGKGGIDWLRLDGSTTGAVVNLVTGTSQDGQGGTDTLISIENVRGFDYNDHITGDGGSNELRGGNGNDTLLGGAGEDTLVGNAGNDSLDGGSHDLAVGMDWVVYSGATGPVNVNLSTGLATGAEGNDTLTGLESVTAGASNDVLVGNADTNFLRGNGGNDTLDGGDGFDLVDYRDASAAVTVNLATNTSTGADGNDVLSNFEGIRGSMYGDNLTGDGNDNGLRGEQGDDTLNGGAGNDYADYRAATGAVTVSLLSNTSTGAEGNDTLISIENIRGSFTYGDTLIGNAVANVIEGRGGDDTLTGGAGGDTFVFRGAGGTLHTMAEGIDTITDFASGDKIYIGASLAALAVTAGTGAAVTGNRVQAQTVAGVTTLYIDTNNVAGTDVQIKLTGSYLASQFTVTNNGDGTSNITVTEDLVLTGTTGADTLAGAAGNDSLTGLAGTDLLQGNAGQDTLDGGAGVDTLDGGTGADRMLGGLGNDGYLVDNAGDVVVEQVGEGTDLVTSSVNFVLPANLENLSLGGTALQGTGNELPNTLTGNASANTLSGLDGNDTLNGNAGNDTLNGGLGDDRLDGQAGADRLVGNAGNDTYLVDIAGDVVVEAADEGTDIVQATASHVLAANVENLVLSGAAINGTGNDLTNVITGSALANSLLGLDGNDTLLGGDGNDTLDGGLGNDRLDGNAGSDRMFGRAGNDFFVVDSASDVVNEALNEGTDTVAAGVSFALVANIENLTLSGTDPINGTGNTLANVITGNIANNVLTGLAGLDTLFGAGGSDTLDGGAGADSLDGGTGADQLTGGLGDDIYMVDNLGDTTVELAAEGVDLVISSLNATLADNIENLNLGAAAAVGIGNVLDNVINGQAANNNLSGLDGNDSLNGFDGNDTLDGGVGNDRLDGGVGADRMFGRLGDDLFIVDNAGDILNEGVDEGTDNVQASVSYALQANIENMTLTGTAGINGTGNSGVNNIFGNAGANVLYGLAGNDSLVGAEGDDTLDGGLGGDRLRGGTGADTYYQDNAADVVVEFVGEGTDLVYSTVSTILRDNVENLTLTGAAAYNGTGNALANVLTGNDLINKLTGMDGDDSLAGYAGADTLDGGAGNDTLDGGAGADRLFGRLGDDTYMVDDALDAIAENLGEGTDTVLAMVTYSLAANLENLTLGGSAANGFGNSSDNVVTGNASNNSLGGNGGNDTLGGLGGADTLTGGAGADFFVIATGGGADTITDFSVAQGDKLKLQAGLNGSAIVDGASAMAAAVDAGGNVVIDLGGGNSVTLTGLSVAALSAADFIVI